MRIGWKRGRDEGQRGRNNIFVGSSRLGRQCLAFLIGVTVSSLYHHSSSSSSSRRTDEGEEATAVHRHRRQNTERRQQDVVVDDGWKSIDVFLGQPRDDDDKKDDIIVVGGGKSQCDQDKLVLALLQEKQRNGYFIDLAANDAIALSNTYQLERHYGWSGICIEPNPRYWDNLVRLRTCHVAAAVVGGKTRNERVNFFLIEGGRAPSAGILGFDNKMTDVGDKSKKKQGRSVPFYTVPLVEILDRYNAPTVIDYLSLDVEGAEYYVMRDFPFDSYAFRILTIERPTQELVDLLYQHRYIYVAANNEHGMETLFLHLDHYYDQQNQHDDSVVQTAVESVGWRFGSTKWIDIVGGAGTMTAQQQQRGRLLTPPKVIGTK
jgi:hypothetical protein